MGDSPISTGAFRRLPRQATQPLSREELRVYMSCLGQRTAAELCEAARLSQAATEQAIAGLLRLGLLQPVQTSADVSGLLSDLPTGHQHQPPSDLGQQSPADFDVQRAMDAVAPVLQANLGARSEEILQRLANSADPAAFGAEVQRTASRLRLVVSVQAAEQLEQAWQDAQP
ncbi:hypothetical protein GCM10017783_01200 [Deinococcus piscis]|uniref:Transcription regulator TrmB N-terminal domain-containing protein n=1 Tax=Deinococcus piscis TaxID=394230 RepID=A0ABQ3JWI1_9DEIO|nr:hypothetical protein [Deinococcus piscis]GHF93078.1 hypothetical protein GCM10017783_01200 [Deinococcus piscis]